ncbi:phosphotransferase [Streptomyces clavuligerus]|uniref:Aminoglycoside phosphotransferase family protein n=1 Tax=Streptomyces clavuligerus TaxID=1901 RepID=E2Q603_STRCL|nr:phosphotransferase [Streptomyces clavuligerus]ANW22126.1 aminoglycoside phosphotransferase [Streptomyces clavuligerus]AXU16773.1 aminoglycoside phosphotransferase [Streptomyces clavuligerus]EFG05163.1 aminoglycoside phosphotransferase family protein [Streptomyces clavuligerus]MBY6306443.1 phosphotransferase [Streptomyces clavuligerus]QCS09533.1 aminoglycoside phosphotransferase [Streptomyces clavuligerus]
MTVFPDGWDSEARLVDGRWVERRPRRPEVAARLLAETRLMPWLAPRLPLAVPVPRVLTHDPLAVRHALVPGAPLEHPTPRDGRLLGRFLRALHTVDAADAVRHGALPAGAARAERAEEGADFRRRVLPLLPPERHRSAAALLDAVRALPAAALVHGDLGPEHLLAEEAPPTGPLTGVIDFGDAHVGDPAIDLAWALYGAGRAVADAVAETYPVTRELRARALLWHRLGPWYEVTHGLDTGDAGTVASGLAGVCDRLGAGPPPPGR